MRFSTLTVGLARRPFHRCPPRVCLWQNLSSAASSHKRVPLRTVSKLYSTGLLAAAVIGGLVSYGTLASSWENENNAGSIPSILSSDRLPLVRYASPEGMKKVIKRLSSILLRSLRNLARQGL